MTERLVVRPEPGEAEGLLNLLGPNGSRHLGGAA